MVFIDGYYLRKLFIDSFGDDKIDFFKLRSYLLDLYDRTPINPFKANLIRSTIMMELVTKNQNTQNKKKTLTH